MNKNNAPLIIEPYKVKDKKINVIRDDYLNGGSKVRGLIPYMQQILKENPDIKEFIYSSPAYGYAQVAISVAAKILGVKSVIFVAKRKEMHPNTKEAQEFGALIKEIPYGYLVVVKKHAQDYVNENVKTRFLLPWGLASDRFKQLLCQSIKSTINLTPRKNIMQVDRIWLVVGSGTMFETLACAFPNPSTKFNLVQVGAEYIIPDYLLDRVDKFFKAPEKYEDKAKFKNKENPIPYPSNPWYDAKIWQFIEEYADNNDYIWNVA